MMLYVLLLLLPLFRHVSTAADSTCYFPDQSVHTLATPCDPNAEVSSCCEGTHTCMSNGLCWDTIWNHVIRGSCTLKSWNDPACPQFCVDNDPSQKGSLGDMRQCNDGNTYWVCGMNATDCSNAFTLPKTYVDDSRAKNLTNIIAAGPSASGASAASGTVTTTVLVTVTASASSTNSPTSSTSPLAAGVGAGLGVGIPLLIALAATIFLLRKAKRENKLLIAGQGQPLQNFNSQEHHKNGPFIHEAPEKSHGSADRFLVHEAPAMEGHR